MKLRVGDNVSLPPFSRQCSHTDCHSEMDKVMGYFWDFVPDTSSATIMASKTPLDLYSRLSWLHRLAQRMKYRNCDVDSHT